MTITKQMSWAEIQHLRRPGESTSFALARYGRETGWRVVTQSASATFLFVRWWAWPFVHAWYRRPRVDRVDGTVYVTWLARGVRLWPPTIWRWQ